MEGMAWLWPVFSGEYPGFRLIEADLKSVTLPAPWWFLLASVLFSLPILHPGKSKGQLGKDC